MRTICGTWYSVRFEWIGMCPVIVPGGFVCNNYTYIICVCLCVSRYGFFILFLFLFPFLSRTLCILRSLYFRFCSTCRVRTITQLLCILYRIWPPVCKSKNTRLATLEGYEEPDEPSSAHSPATINTAIVATPPPPLQRDFFDKKLQQRLYFNIIL